MTILWDNKSAAEATQGIAHGSPWQAARVEIDSRKVRPGDVFVAIKGERFDGHAFVADAFKNGAVAALVSRMVPGNIIIVEDTLKGLEGLARQARARSKAKIIGVTGSVGKTSAKEMLKLALLVHGEVFATSGNYNNHIGTPLNLANLPPHTPFAVFEMGMNHAGEISHLTNMVKPHVAVITTVEAVHLEFFTSVEGIATAKAEIFEGVDNDGTAIIGGDHPYWEHLKIKASRRGIRNIVLCGEAQHNDALLLDYHPTHEGCAVKAGIAGKELSYTLGALGRHWATTSVLALAAAHALGLDLAKTAQALNGFRELEGRGKILRVTVDGGEAMVIDDSYNASPAAMHAAFSKVAELWEIAGKKGRKLAALGDMLELGEREQALHAGLANELARSGFTSVFTAGGLMQSLHDALPSSMRGGHVKNAKDLLPLLTKALHKDDILLIKGSHGSKIYEVADALLKSLPAAGDKKHAV